MTSLLAMFLWMTGQPVPAENPVDPGVTVNGGGIPVVRPDQL